MMEKIIRKKTTVMLVSCLLTSTLTGCGILDMAKKVLGNSSEMMEETQLEEEELFQVELPEEIQKLTQNQQEKSAKAGDAQEQQQATREEQGKQEEQKKQEEQGKQEEQKSQEAQDQQEDFSDIQIDLDSLSYSRNREDFPNDAAFANFRNLCGGEINICKFFRSVSPVYNGYGRAAYADAFAREVGIRSVLNLSDSMTEIQGFLQESGPISPYYQQLLAENRVLAIDLSSDYHKNSFAFALAEGLRKMMDMEGPVLIHCIEGKDRTGFVCLLLEALAHASYDEVVKDYMTSFDNYLGINQESNPRYYRYIRQEEVDSLIRHIALEDEHVDASTIDLYMAARQYLSNAGLTQEELDRLETYVKQ